MYVSCACYGDKVPYTYLAKPTLLFSVIQGRKDLCDYGYLNVAGPSGYIANAATERFGYGSSRCPWVIKAQPGQRINVTLVDFSQMGPQEDASTGAVRPRYCREYAMMRETKTVRSIVVCDGDPPQKHIYISDGHVVEIELEKNDSPDANFRFLLQYEGQYKT